jgi:AraC family transcriptional regulator
MREQGAYGDQLARVFGMRDAPALVTHVLRKSRMAVTDIRCPQNFGRTASIPREDAYLVALQMRSWHDHDLFLDGRRCPPARVVAGATCIYDLRRDPVWVVRDPCHAVMLYLPCAALNAVAHEAGQPRVGELRHQPGVGIEDPVVRHLLSALLPFTARPEEAPAMLLDNVALALGAHIAQVYGGMPAVRGIPRGGLAPWQERRAKELMSAALNEEIPLGRLAAECGLSVQHFARAFRQSTGTPPHRWLLKQRVDRAKTLLTDRGVSLADIAVSCGFADQSHFTRIFTAMVGVSPGAWRRASVASHDVLAASVQSVRKDGHAPSSIVSAAGDRTPPTCEAGTRMR